MYDTGYQSNFEIQLNSTSSKWQVKIVDPISNDILNKNTELLITMTVAESGSLIKGTSVLILKLPQSDEPSIVFGKEFYIAKYPISGTGTLDFDNAIVFTNLADSSNVKIALNGETHLSNSCFNILQHLSYLFRLF